MKLQIKKYIKSILLTIITIANIFIFYNVSFAENLDVNFSYGIHNVAKSSREFPIELTINNKDTQDFDGYMTLNVYENNISTFVYRYDVNIAARQSIKINSNISVANNSNTIEIYVFNKKEELIINERTNIDLSYYNDRLIIGCLTSNFRSLAYIDNLIFANSAIQTKVVEITNEDIANNKNILDLIDLLLISDYDYSQIEEKSDDAIYNYLTSGKSILLGLDGKNSHLNIPNFLQKYLIGTTRLKIGKTDYNFLNSQIIEKYDDESNIKKLTFEDGFIVCVPFSFAAMSNNQNSDKWFIDLLEKCFDRNWFMKTINKSNSLINNDYYNLSSLLNMINKDKLPDIFVLTALLGFYVIFLTIIIYTFLRNTNQRNLYGRFALIFSAIYTIIMFVVGYSVMKKSTFLTYLSIVNIKDANVKETAFLNFRTSENGDYEFDTSKNIKLSPVLRNNREPIVGLDFMNRGAIKVTTITETEERKKVSVQNAKDFDSNVFIYENDNYLNDVYNVDSSFRRFDGSVTGRITNNMSVTIKEAKVLLYGKVLDIGDIEPNHSISLSRAKSIGVPVSNNTMIADVLADEVNHNIVKYYLDENVNGYFDYGLLIGFLDVNGTIDINSRYVGDTYGRTMIVTKINKDAEVELEDVCSLENEINTIEGYYDYVSNTINGDESIVNEYKFEPSRVISKLYFEGIDNYDKGYLDSYVPFYGEIQAFNYNNDSYETISNDGIGFENINKYLTPDNRVIIRFNPSSMDPLYRKISLPILRAIISK